MSAPSAQPIVTPAYCLTMAQYNRWMNRKLYERCGAAHPRSCVARSDSLLEERETDLPWLPELNAVRE